jgi:hypothetical protein
MSLCECRYAKFRDFFRYYAECRTAECRYAECRYAECAAPLHSTLWHSA